MPKSANTRSNGFTAREMAWAKEMSKYENLWVALSKKGGREKVVASGVRITDAKAAADKTGEKNLTYMKVPSSRSILIV